jgi:acetyltransferase-like isoleucine patch superfamily enzyme
MESEAPYYLGAGVRLYGDVRIGAGCVIEDYCVIGKPDMYALDAARREAPHQPQTDGTTTLDSGVILGAGTKVYAGSVLDEGVETEDDVRIGWNARVGARTRLMYGAQVYCGVTIGADCRVAGFVGDNVRLAERVAFFGSAVHDYPRRTVTYEPRPSPRVLSDAIVAVGAVLVGGVTVGKSAYIAANAVVTRDVPPDHVCFGANRLVPRSEWPGRLGHFTENPSCSEGG